MRSVYGRLFPGLVSALVGAAGCSASDLLSNQPLTLNVTVAQTAAGHTTTMNGQQVWACSYTFTARASGGTSLDYAQWFDGHIDLRLNSAGTTTTLSLGALDLQDWFGSDQVKAGSAVSANRTLYWAGPFTGTAVFRYEATDANSGTANSKSAAVDITC